MTRSATPRLVIVGGGPSGLAAAWRASGRARDAGADLEVVVLEAESEVGGKARTRFADGLMIETGPQGFLDDQPAVRLMIQACGLGEEVIAPEPDANRRYIHSGGKQRELKRTPLGFASSGLLSIGGLARLAMEPLVPRRFCSEDAEHDESLFDFAARRMGVEAAERLISPVTLGIFAGDARHLSAAAVFPRLVQWEEAHGSLFRAMRVGRRAGGAPPVHRSFAGGIGTLARGVAGLPEIDVRCSHRVTSVERRAGGGFTVAKDDDSMQADAVVVAADLPAAADLVAGVSEQAGEELRQIESPPMAVVHTAFRAARTKHVRPAYGFLVARGEGIRMLGCQYETATFRGRSPADRFLTRSLFGGAVDPTAALLDDDALVELTLRELRRTARIRVAPTWTGVARWPHAIPQYALGHPQRVERIEAALEQEEGFFLAGNALHGVGLSRAISVGAERGSKAARLLLG